MAACVGFVAEISAPDAEALSILLPSGSGNAIQINILESNIFNPQFGSGGANVSDNHTIGGIIFGLGNGSPEGTSSGIFGPIAFGGANGNGNVTQINILSYNIFNPQVSTQGGNLSNNTTVSNVAIANGNGSASSSGESGGVGVAFLGAAMGNGNTTQIAFLSGNIFNPQLSLFGDNVSNNTAVTNVSGLNGNLSENSTTSGGLFGTNLLAAVAGNGNTTQIGWFAGNVINTQISLSGSSTSNNTAVTNVSGFNGNFGDNSTTSGGFLGTHLLAALTGNGNTSQFGGFVSNIFNSQFSYLGQNASSNEAITNTSIGNGTFSDNEILVGVNGNGNSQKTATAASNINNKQLRLGNWLPGMDLPATEGANDTAEIRDSLVAIPGSTGMTNTPPPLGTDVTSFEAAVDQTEAAVREAHGINGDSSSGDNVSGAEAPSGADEPND